MQIFVYSMKHDAIYIGHILDAIGTIRSHTAGKNREDFLDNKLIQDAVIREIEIIGETAKNVSNDYQKLHPAIAWKDIAGMRDKLIHGYFGVDLSLVWKTVQEDLSPLEQELLRVCP